ncbi:MAG: DUF3106 domain-containing protein [Clostridiales bacterium]|jgi:hypothetical protein|nr:DUF3106 domain-containing protein [Clostridiales bacterium]
MTVKKLTALVFVISSLSLGLTGCATANAVSAANPGGEVQAGSGGEAGAPSETERLIILGEIVETVGNMITLNLMEEREIPPMTGEERTDIRERMEQNGGAPGMELTEEERSALREQFEQNGGGPQPPQNGEGGFPAGEDGMPQGMPEGFTFEMPEGMPEGFPGGGRGLTGEVRDIIIPAGAPVMEASAESGENGPTESEISLEKLKPGDVIQVTYASDNETVAKVVKQPSTGAGMRFNAEGGFPGQANGEGDMFFFGGPGAAQGGGETREFDIEVIEAPIP